MSSLTNSTHEFEYVAHIYNDDGKFSVEFPDVQGVWTWGDTLEEAKVYAEDALRLTLECMLDEDLCLPYPNTKPNEAKDLYVIKTVIKEEKSK